ncbi:MAG: hypothetical protein MRZ24_04635 [Clostridiales bacterium]|nr:hypothetical protein [Clostridiales bacterium]
MEQQEFRSGSCPQCGHALKVPAELEKFSCMYCGARLTQPELVTQQPLAADEAAVAAYDDAAAQLAGCVTNWRGYQKRITRNDFVAAFSEYEAGCSQVVELLNTGVCAGNAERTALLTQAASRMLDDLAASWKQNARNRHQLEDDKIVVAIFFVPLVRKLQLPISEEFVDILQKQWVARYPKSPFYLGDYDSIANGFRKKFLGLCFITTAVCQAEGKPDDCEELTAFRAFRDGYLRSCPDGPALIDEYYNIAPGIVRCIDLCTDAPASYAAIRETYLAPCYDDIQNGRLERCKQRYTRMVRDLEQQYLS